MKNILIAIVYSVISNAHLSLAFFSLQREQIFEVEGKQKLWNHWFFSTIERTINFRSLFSQKNLFSLVIFLYLFIKTRERKLVKNGKTNSTRRTLFQSDSEYQWWLHLFVLLFKRRWLSWIGFYQHMQWFVMPIRMHFYLSRLSDLLHTVRCLWVSMKSFIQSLT